MWWCGGRGGGCGCAAGEEQLLEHARFLVGRHLFWRGGRTGVGVVPGVVVVVERLLVGEENLGALALELLAEAGAGHDAVAGEVGGEGEGFVAVFGALRVEEASQVGCCDWGVEERGGLAGGAG